MKARQEPRVSSQSPFRYRNFTLLWCGQTVSVAGNGIFFVALPLEVLRIGGSPLDLALVASARMVPTVLLLLVGGTLADQVSRRLVMLISDAASGLAVSVVAVLIALNRVRLWELLLLSVTFGITNAFFMPAATAITRDILPVRLLVPASSLISLSQSLGQYLAGPLAGGFTVAFLGSSWSFAIDGMSFMVSACFLAFMRGITRVRAERATMMRDIKDGLRYSRSQPWLWWSMIAVGIANLVSFVPLSIVLQPLLVRHVFKAGPILLGMMYAANGTGGALASLYVKRRGAPRHRVIMILASWAGAGLAGVFLGLSPWAWLATLFAGAMWFSLTYGNILWFPLLQERVRPELLGRVSSVDWLLSLALNPLGIIAGGISAGFVGTRLTIIIGGVIAAAAAGSAIAIPGVREPAAGPVDELKSTSNLAGMGSAGEPANRHVKGGSGDGLSRG